MMPAEGLAQWMKQDPEVRKGEEKKMKDAWNVWMSNHTGQIKESAGAGKTKRVTATGVADVANDVMLYSMVEAESHEAAAKIFEGHPHLAIPGASIDVMPANALPEV